MQRNCIKECYEIWHPWMKDRKSMKLFIDSKE